MRLSSESALPKEDVLEGSCRGCGQGAENFRRVALTQCGCFTLRVCLWRKGFPSAEEKPFVPIITELVTVWETQIILLSVNYLPSAEGCNLLPGHLPLVGELWGRFAWVTAGPASHWWEYFSRKASWENAGSLDGYSALKKVFWREKCWKQNGKISQAR